MGCWMLRAAAEEEELVHFHFSWDMFGMHKLTVKCLMERLVLLLASSLRISCGLVWSVETHVRAGSLRSEADERTQIFDEMTFQGICGRQSALSGFCGISFPDGVESQGCAVESLAKERSSCNGLLPVQHGLRNGWNQSQVRLGTEEGSQ